MAGVLSFYLMIMIMIAMIIQYAAMGKRKILLSGQRDGAGNAPAYRTYQIGGALGSDLLLLSGGSGDSGWLQSDYVVFKLGKYPAVPVYSG